jgi:hypothetical protein
MNAFAFAPAVRRNTHVLIALAGASGSGKTYSALELATGLAGESGKIAAIDTEADRALHYADRFKFDHCNLTPPFTPDRYREAIVAAEQAGYAVIVIDSMSHEHDGEGGLIEMAEQELQKRKDGNGAAAWALPKAKHKRMMNRLLQVRAHLVFCLRAEDKIKIVKVFDERRQREITTVEPAGWIPVIEKRFMFEMTASFILTPDNPGVPTPIKLQEQHRPAFPKGAAIGRESGRRIADWASGGAAPERQEAAESETLNKRAIAAARGGKAAFRSLWQGLDADERDHLRPMMKEFEAMTTKADSDDDPFGGQDEHPEERKSSTLSRKEDPPPNSTHTKDAASRGERASLAVDMASYKPAGGKTDWEGIAKDMVAMIAELTELDDAATNGQFVQQNRGALEGMRTGNRAQWSEVYYLLGERYRALNGGEP